MCGESTRGIGKEDTWHNRRVGVGTVIIVESLELESREVHIYTVSFRSLILSIFLKRLSKRMRMIYPIHFAFHFLVGVFCFWILPFPSKMTSVSGYGCPYCIITQDKR